MTTTNPASLNLGFLTVLHDTNGYMGGYLVTNFWGRPLEFRLSTAVQPNKVQQILYGGTLQPFICADLIGKALVEKASAPIQLLLTDREPVLELRLKVETPIAWLASVDDPLAAALANGGAEVRPADNGHGPLLCHPRFPGDVVAIRAVLQRLDSTIDLSEPFARIREAMTEARKSGVTSRAG